MTTYARCDWYVCLESSITPNIYMTSFNTSSIEPKMVVHLSLANFLFDIVFVTFFIASRCDISKLHGNNYCHII